MLKGLIFPGLLKFVIRTLYQVRSTVYRVKLFTLYLVPGTWYTEAPKPIGWFGVPPIAIAPNPIGWVGAPPIAAKDTCCRPQQKIV